MAIHSSNQLASSPNRLITRRPSGVNLRLTKKQSESLQLYFYIKILIQYRLLYPIRQRLSALLLLPVDRSMGSTSQTDGGCNSIDWVHVHKPGSPLLQRVCPAQTVSFMNRLDSTPARFSSELQSVKWTRMVILRPKVLREVYNVHYTVSDNGEIDWTMTNWNMLQLVLLFFFTYLWNCVLLKAIVNNAAF